MLKIQNFKITENNTTNSSSFKVVETRPSVDNGATLFITVSTQSPHPSLTVKEFAGKASVTPQAVRKMILEGRVDAINLGKQYLIGQEELDRYLLKR